MLFWQWDGLVVDNNVSMIAESAQLGHHPENGKVRSLDCWCSSVQLQVENTRNTSIQTEGYLQYELSFTRTTSRLFHALPVRPRQKARTSPQNTLTLNQLMAGEEWWKFIVFILKVGWSCWWALMGIVDVDSPLHRHQFINSLFPQMKVAMLFGVTPCFPSGLSSSAQYCLPSYALEGRFSSY